MRRNRSPNSTGSRQRYRRSSGRVAAVACSPATGSSAARRAGRGPTRRLDDVPAPDHCRPGPSVPTGESLTGLSIKDFRLRFDNGSTVDPLVVDKRTAMPDALQIVLLLDCSNSTKGPALAAAKAGGAGMLKQFQGIAHVK